MERNKVSVNILTDKCIGCGECTQKCSHNAIKLKYYNKKAYAGVYSSKCIGCKECSDICKYKALEILEMSEVI